MCEGGLFFMLVLEVGGWPVACLITTVKGLCKMTKSLDRIKE